MAIDPSATVEDKEVHMVAQSAVPADDTLSRLCPRNRVQAVRRMLLPTALRKAVNSLLEDERRIQCYDRRLEAIDRLAEWAATSTSILELQQRVLGGNQVTNLLELAIAFRVILEHIEFEGLNTSELADRPLAIASQVIHWWSEYMRRMPAVTYN